MYFRVFFPSGRYWAAETHDPSYPEWPPHPTRLFSALVAAAYRSSEGMTTLKRRALEWLESLPSPSIAAPAADLARAPVCYVPPGDLREKKGKKGEEQYEHGVFRWRQARYFPNSIIMGEPEVCYGWDEDPDVDFFQIIDDIAADVTHLGTSHSIAVMKCFKGTMQKPAMLMPDPAGTQFLRICAKGRLKELDAIFQQESGVRRPTPQCERLSPYRLMKEGLSKAKTASSEFLPLRITGTMHGADTAAYLARALRRAVMSVLGDDAPPAVHGHNGGKHVGWIPLPDVGHRHASGRIIGIGILLPKELDLEERNKVLAGISRVRELRLPDGRVSSLFPSPPGERLPLALLHRTWTQTSDTWATVTPVVLDRPPKRLTPERVRKALSESLIFAGYPEPRDVQVSAFSLFTGSPPAFRVSAEKPRYHAIVKFKEPVSGPVIAGRLRYFGIGLFRPLESPDYIGVRQ